jgi:hypothetical protein
MNKILDTPYVHLELKDDILIGTYKKGIKMNMEMARSIVNARLEFTGGKDVLALIASEGIVSMDKRTREFMASKEGSKGIKAAAIILKSSFGSFVANFYLSVNKPPMPVRIFTNTRAAINWLQKFREK